MQTSSPPTTLEGHDLHTLPEYTLHAIPDHKSPPLEVTLKVNSTDLVMEIDTGASLSIISELYYHKKFGNTELEPTEIVLRTYSGENIDIKGVIMVTVIHNSQSATLPLVVVKGNGPTLLGRNWLSELCLDWHSAY